MELVSNVEVLIIVLEHFHTTLTYQKTHGLNQPTGDVRPPSNRGGLGCGGAVEEGVDETRSQYSQFRIDIS
jgi:hypothetical protein